MLRKLLLMGVATFVADDDPDSVTQLVFGLLVCLAASTAHEQFWPFRERVDNRLQRLSLAATLVTHIGAIMWRLRPNTADSSDPPTPAAVVLLVIQLTPLVIGVALLAIGVATGVNDLRATLRFYRAGASRLSRQMGYKSARVSDDSTCGTSEATHRSTKATASFRQVGVETDAAAPAAIELT